MQSGSTEHYKSQSSLSRQLSSEYVADPKYTWNKDVFFAFVKQVSGMQLVITCAKAEKSIRQSKSRNIIACQD